MKFWEEKSVKNEAAEQNMKVNPQEVPTIATEVPAN
jgi:hypothetical protein